MAKFGDVAWTEPEPAGVVGKTEPNPDPRIDDAAYTAQPAGGWGIPGAEGLLPYAHEPGSPGVKRGGGFTILKASGTVGDPALVQIEGWFLDGGSISIEWNIDGGATQSVSPAVVGDQDAVVMAGSVAYVVALYVADIDFVAALPGQIVQLAPATGTTLNLETFGYTAP